MLWTREVISSPSIIAFHTHCCLSQSHLLHCILHLVLVFKGPFIPWFLRTFPYRHKHLSSRGLVYRVYLGPIYLIGGSPRIRQKESSLLLDLVVSHVLDSSSLLHRWDSYTLMVPVLQFLSKTPDMHESFQLFFGVPSWVPPSGSSLHVLASVGSSIISFSCSSRDWLGSIPQLFVSHQFGLPSI